MRKNTFALFFTLLCYGIFTGAWSSRPHSPFPSREESLDRVVLPTPVQIMISGGDRFLAANFESIRVSATAGDAPSHTKQGISFSIRARRIVGELNPCHEDNYYEGNALLTWGGSVNEGNHLLKLAADCRLWDELPPFFYGFNRYFFLNDITGAREALETAASRSHTNAAGFRRLAIMLAAGELKDDSAALDFLQQERAQTSDPKLQGMLDKRIARLQGLITLREAQQRYEARFGQPLTNPQALIDSGELEAFPNDPLRIGYEFADGRFRLKELKIAGLERP